MIVGGLEHPQPPIQFIKESMIGGRNRVSEVLSRKRPLTINMIRRLSERMHIPAGVLIRPYETGDKRP